MKNILIVAFGFIIFSCNSSDKKTTEDKSKNEAGLQNDNGGIPDTSNAINLSTHKKDTTMKSKDSLK